MAVPKTQYVGPEDQIIFIDEFGVRRAQRCEYTPNFNNVEASEIGALGLIETVPDLITTNVTLDTNDWGSVDTLQMLLGEKAAAPYVSGVVNSGVLTENDFEYAEVDLILAIREDSTLRRSRLLPNQYLIGFDFTYNIDGVATENYRFAGDQDMDFVGKYADLRVLRGTYVTASSFKVKGVYQTSFTGYQVSIDNQVVSTGNQIQMTASGAADTLVTLTNFSGISSTSRLRAHVYKTTPETFANRRVQANVNQPGYAAVMGRQVKIYLGDSTITPVASNKALRLQSVAISADLARDDIKELGNDRLVGKSLNIPIRISVTCEAIETDLETYAKLIGGASLSAWNNYQSDPVGNGAVFTPDMLAASGRKLIVEIYKERSNPTTLLKTITMTGLSITGKSGNIALNARGAMTWNLQGSFITISGNNQNPLT